MCEFTQDKNVTIWFSRLNSLITKINGEKIKMTITKFLPVIKQNMKQLTLLISEEEVKLTLQEVIEYLKTTDAEKAISIIEN